MSATNPIEAAIDQMVEQRTESTLGTIAASLAAIAKAVLARPADPAIQTLQSMLTELNQGLGDLVSALEPDDDAKSDPAAIAKAITAGLKAMRIEVKPQITVEAATVNVNPTPIENHFDPTIVVEREKGETTFKVEMGYGPWGQGGSFTITRTNK